ncbi:SUN domain-containing ossification factor-like isoform X2 [Tachypleus tridentatus]|uniref:SUN domain-containing ossification factor-like isoform X2 n=1 Tax=Tachypleus tridentatus TaxID=6853 RepID=UPI003FD61C60
MPREFSVYWSDRYPVRDWMLIGNYEADNRRELQSFPLKQTGYGKFIKVEFDSHYGSEHYCPLSTVRVFGTSMVEEYEIMETADEPSHPLSLENEDDRLDISDESHVRTNLFGSAKEAILNIVKKVVLVLSGKEKEIQEEKDVGTEPPTKVQSSDTETKSVTNYSVSSNTTANVTEYYGKNIALPHGISKLIPYLFTYDLCNIHNKLHSDTSSLACWFLHVVLGPKSPDQLCFMNSVPQPMVDKAVKCEKGTTLQLGYNVEELHYSIANLPTSGPTELPVVTSESVTLTLITQNTSGSLPYDQSSILSHSLRDENLANIQEKIQPTQTFPESSKISEQVDSEELTVLLNDQLQPEFDKIFYTEEMVNSGIQAAGYDHLSVNSMESKEPRESPERDEEVEDGDEPKHASTNYSHVVRKEDDTEVSTDHGREGVIVEEKQIPNTHLHEAGPSGSGQKHDPVIVLTQAGQKESIFMRLSNRIKALELNMSLSSRYLEELSQRYRRHMEEMQKAFDRTIGALNVTTADAADRNLHQEEVIGQLLTQVANLTQTVDLLLSEKEMIHEQILEIHVCFLVIQVIILVAVLSLYVRRFFYSPYQHSVAMSLSTDIHKQSIVAGSPVIPEAEKKRIPRDEITTSAVTKIDMASWDKPTCGGREANHSYHGRSSSQAPEKTEEQEAKRNGDVCIKSELKQTSGK